MDLQEVAGLVVLAAGGARLFRIEPQRRNADLLARLQPALGFGALAVDPQFAFADHALDMAEGQAGKARLEKAVDPHAVFVRGDRDGLHLAGQRRFGSGESSGFGRASGRLHDHRLGDGFGDAGRVASRLARASAARRGPRRGGPAICLVERLRLPAARFHLRALAQSRPERPNLEITGLNRNL